jgi:two-component system sensor histidine kinase PilS (NtrC family)
LSDHSESLGSSARRALTAPPGLEKRLLVLMGARLAISIISLALALGLEAAGWDSSPADWTGFYGTVAFAFLATIAYGVILGRVSNVRRFAAVNIATDIAIVSALVHMSGGPDSPFAFLYIGVAVYAALLIERRGALFSAIASAVVYGAVLAAGHQGWMPGPSIAVRDPAPVLFGKWVFHSGAVVLVAGLASLLTAELRRTGEALAQSTQDLSRLRTLHQRTVESLVSGLLTSDPIGRITSFNPEAERITGMRGEDVVGLDVESVLPGVRDLVMRGANDNPAQRSRARTPDVNQDGEARHLGVAAYVLKNDAGQPGGHVVIFQDVTDVVEMETSLRRSERLAAVGELSASIAHEIRNPLAAISGSIEMLQSQRSGGAERGDPETLMAIVLREVDRLDDLISDFLDYARPSPSQPRVVSVPEVVEEVIKMFDAGDCDGVTTHLELEPGLSVLADPSQFRQVLWNLVLNAAQAMPDGGRLQISARAVADASTQELRNEDRKSQEGEKKADWGEIVVSDDGVGIPDEVLDRIFDPFFTTKQNGSGLGLAMVHRIVEDHEGSIGLESSQGGGTRVRVRFPATEATA